MTILFSATTMGFYHSDVNAAEDIPSDAVEISQSEFDSLMQAQADGSVIESSGGYPVAVAPDPLAPPVAGLIAQVTNRQLRLALFDAGKLSDIDAAIATMIDPQQTRFSINWNYSNEFERSSQTVATIAEIIGYNDAQMDALFLSAIQQ